jgi:hypothetical protein
MPAGRVKFVLGADGRRRRGYHVCPRQCGSRYDERPKREDGHARFHSLPTHDGPLGATLRDMKVPDSLGG